MKTKIFLSNNIQNLEEEVNKFLIENGVTKIHAMSTDIEKNTKKFNPLFYLVEPRHFTSS